MAVFIVEAIVEPRGWEKTQVQTISKDPGSVPLGEYTILPQHRRSATVAVCSTNVSRVMRERAKPGANVLRWLC
jgi:hypothetical protein